MKNKDLATIVREAYEDDRRLVAPLIGFPGLKLIGSNIKLAQQNYGEQYRAIKKLAERFAPDLMFPLMDLSVEANAIGRYTIFPQHDHATVSKTDFDMDELDRLREIKIAYDGRANVYAETMRMMNIGLPESMVKGAYVTGPYTAAALILGADDAAMSTIMNPDDLHTLCAFTTEKIQEYARMLITAGAEVVCILEPSGVMLGPDQFKAFSADYVRQIFTACKFDGVDLIYHVCGDAMHLIDGMVESGVDGLSLDSKEAGIDLKAVAEKVPEDVVLIGNTNPTATMVDGTPEQVRREVRELLAVMEPYPNFILSTGCDLPPETPLENIEAFMETGRGGAQ